MGRPHEHHHDHDDHHHHEDHDGRDVTLRERIVRLFHATVGHQHFDAPDRTLESSERGMTAVKISLVGLGLTAAFQLAIVMVSGSVALLSDTVHNFADALTAIPLWIAFVVGRRAANPRYTYGYGRAEDLAGIFVVAMIALTAGVAGWESLQRLLAPRPVEHVGWVLVAGFVGFLGNELVALYRIRVGNEIGSAALVADGHHARADGITSLGVVGGAAGVMLGFPIADPLVGLLITLAVLFVLKDAATRIFHRLMDAVDPELTAAAARVVAASDGVTGEPEVRIRWIGHELWADAQITVDSDRSLAEAHAIAETAQHELMHHLPRLAHVTVHVDPCMHDGIDHHDSTAHHFAHASRGNGVASASSHGAH